MISFKSGAEDLPFKNGPSYSVNTGCQQNYYIVLKKNLYPGHFGLKKTKAITFQSLFTAV